MTDYIIIYKASLY